MSDSRPMQPPGWYYAQGDPPGTQRHWDGSQWVGDPQPVAGAAGFPGRDLSGLGLALTSPGKRIGARLIDLLIWVIISSLISLILGGDLSDNSAGAKRLLVFVVVALAIVAYETVFVALKGGTPGKLALGMRVVPLELDAVAGNHAVDYATAAKRMAFVFLSVIPWRIGTFLTLIVGVLSVALLFTDKDKQAVWDKFAGTVVVDV